MKDPTKSLSQVIAGIDNARDVLHDDFPFRSLFLNGEMLDLDMTGTSGDDRNDSFTNSVQWHQTFSQGIEFCKNVLEILGSLGTSVSWWGQ